MTKMQTQLKLFAALMVISAALLLPISDAQAQAMSARGIATGGDTVAAIVPEAGNLFQTIDVVQDLQDAIVACARDGRFVADADNLAAGCRQGVPPVVDFTQDTSGTFATVQNAYPNQDTEENYGNLDGRDGVCRLTSGGLCP